MSAHAAGLFLPPCRYLFHPFHAQNHSCVEEARAAESEAATKAKKRKEEQEEAAEEHKAAAARGDSQAAGAALARAGSMRKRVSIIGQEGGGVDGSMVSNVQLLL